MIRVPKYVGWPLVGAWSFGVFYFLANRSVFYPLKYPQGWWEAQQQVGAEDVYLDTEDGVRLHSWWITAPQARLVTLYLHGNAGNLTFRVGHIREIVAAGSSMLLPDYRGYGKSEGKPSEDGLYRDAEASYQYLIRKGYRPEQIVLHGESLGTAVAVELGARRPCAGLVLEAPFTSAREVAGRLLPVLGPMVIRGFDSLAKIERVRAPVLVIHGDRDEVIAYDLGRKLFEAAREPKSFWTVAGAGHNNLVEAGGSAYRERLREFYAGLRP